MVNRTDTYKRGQVEWALWRYFADGQAPGGRPPRIFRTRVKRLLELDRATEPYASETAQARWAFFDDSPEGQGTDARYTAFNVFCLALGLDLLDTGFKQSEIVFLLRHIRADLQDRFERALAAPPDPRQREAAAQRPDCASYEERGRRWADCRVFLVLNKVEVTEVFGDSRGKTPLILEPIYCRGIDALRKELHRMNAEYRKALVIELAHTAAGIARLLGEAPVIRRGRG